MMLNQNIRYLLEADKPYSGSVQSILLEDGTVAYSDGLTVEQYEQDRGVKLRIIDEDELMELERAYIDSRVTEPKPVTEEKWWDALEVLPPCRWKTVKGVELFHISERITADLVDWYARVGDRYFHFTDRSGRPMEELADKVGAVL